MHIDLSGLRAIVTASAGDIANVAAFLRSPLGRNISGQALSVRGNVETMA